MSVASYKLQPPKLQEIASVKEKALQKNNETSSVCVTECPDLRSKPFHLAARGLSGNECIADVGGQPNLYPRPNLSARYSLMSIADQMEIGKESGMLIGAGAGPFFDVGVNNELAPNIQWEFQDGRSGRVVHNQAYYASIDDKNSVICQKCPTTNCALMMNLYGSAGLSGPVLKVTARKNIGRQGLTVCIRFGLRDHYGSETPISIGGVFLIKKSVASFHVMPGFPPEERMPFKSPKQLNDWLTYHKFSAPMVCLSEMHSDPGEKLAPS